MGTKVNLAGQRFGRLLVLGEAPKRALNGAVYWLCRCDCGGARAVLGSALTFGRTKSCGCLRAEFYNRIRTWEIVNGIKTCLRCGGVEFYATGCRSCNLTATKIRSASNPTIRRKKAIAWNRANRQRRRQILLKYEYGLTAKDHNDLLIAQGGVCAICKLKPSKREHLDVDHCHKTGMVRGLLCNPCNTALGQFYDDPARLQSALEYLWKSSLKQVA